MNVKTKVSVLIISMTLSLIGCGGSSDSSVAAPTVLKGTFLDSAVEGMKYTTATQSGYTDSSGQFDYVEGEIITFGIEDISIGSTLATAEVTPLDFNALDDASREKHINMLRLLQTLDNDGDAVNGIQLSAGIGAGDSTVDFDQSSAAFEADQIVIDFVAANANVGLISETQALAHFANTLNATASTTIVDFTNSAWVEWMRLDTGACVSDWIPTTRFHTFTGTTVTATLFGDTINSTTCIKIPEAQTEEVIAYTDFFDQVFVCGLECSYSDLNRIFFGTDADGREVETFGSYDTESGIIFNYKKIINNPGFPGENGFIYEFKLIKE